MVDKTKAVELREQGFQYSEIAQQLGCSEVWCKKNLKDVVKGERKYDGDVGAETLRAIGILENALKELRGI